MFVLGIISDMDNMGSRRDCYYWIRWLSVQSNIPFNLAVVRRELGGRGFADFDPTEVLSHR